MWPFFLVSLPFRLGMFWSERKCQWNDKPRTLEDSSCSKTISLLCKLRTSWSGIQPRTMAYRRVWANDAGGFLVSISWLWKCTFWHDRSETERRGQCWNAEAVPLQIQRCWTPGSPNGMFHWTHFSMVMLTQCPVSVGSGVVRRMEKNNVYQQDHYMMETMTAICKCLFPLGKH